MADPNYGESSNQRTTGSYPLGPPTDGAFGPVPHQYRQPGLAGPSMDLGYSTNSPEAEAPKPSRNRKKSAPGSDQVKHRRTRSGCYTCRSRRVKCDEARPICERCKKGSRDCVYPEKSTTAKQTSRSSKQSQAATQGAPESSSDEYDAEISPEPQRLEAIPDEEGSELANTGTSSKSNAYVMDGLKSTTRQSSETPSLVQDKGMSPTPSSEGSVGYPSYQTTNDFRLKPKKSTRSFATPDSAKFDWSHLPPDLQFYLAYFYENVTHLHYSLKFDPSNTMKTTFIDAALGNEALLYGVVGFSAFQRTLHTPGGKIEDFLQYYNKAVSLLLKSFKKGEPRTMGTLLAILQLATIEEFLGDWLNLLGHQKAAYEILLELYTPQTIVLDAMPRVILGWYMRFDAFASLMSGVEMVIDRGWLVYATEYYEQQVAREPSNLTWKIEISFTKIRLLTMDMSTIFAKNGKGQMTHDQFLRENGDLRRRIVEWKTHMDPALQDSRYLVMDFPGAQAVDPDNIINPYAPGVMYSGPLWTINTYFVDWYSIDVMHRYHTALAMKTQPGKELAQIAYSCCQMVDAILLWPGSPRGTILAIQASLGIACLFLPRDHKHSMWTRRHLAKVEACGYIYPHAFRTKMSQLFREPSCMHWWLPNDEGYPPITKSIRKFVEERTSPAVDLVSEDLKEMKQIFSSMKLNDEPADDGKERGALEVAVASDQDAWAVSGMGARNMQDLGQMDPRERQAYDSFNGHNHWRMSRGGNV